MRPVIKFHESGGDPSVRGGGTNFELMGFYVGRQSFHNYERAEFWVPVRRPLDASARRDMNSPTVPLEKDNIRVRSIGLYDADGRMIRWGWELIRPPEDLWETPEWKRIGDMIAAGP